MLLRKPYAFLIKYFKLLHFVLAVLIGYVAVKLYLVSNFLTDYISKGYYDFVSSLSNIYIGSWLYVAIIVILIILASILLLLIFKKKPLILYIIILICYILTLLYLSSLSNNLKLIEVEQVNLRSLAMVKDIAKFLSYIQAVLCFWIFLRSLGFDVKKFKFGEDIKEFKIESADKEEFEFTINIDKENILLRFKRRLRMIKYSFAEHKFLYMILPVAIILIGGIWYFVSKNYINKIYNEKEIISSNGINYVVESSYLLNTDYKGTKLKENYVVVKYKISNVGNKNYKLSLDKYFVKISDKLYSTDTRLYGNFKDIGKGYTDQNIIAGSNATYILAFKVGNNNSTEDIYLKIPTSNREKTVKLLPITYSEYKKNTAVQNGTKLVFKNSVLGNSSIIISEVSLSDSFTINYSLCDYGCQSYTVEVIPSVLNEENTILKFKIDLNILEELNLEKMTNYEFINNYSKLKYKIDNKVYEVNYINKTPNDYKGDNLYFEVPIILKKADSIFLEINLRNQQYTYILR